MSGLSRHFFSKRLARHLPWLLWVIGCVAAVAAPGPRRNVPAPPNEPILLWSADVSLGPVYYPVDADPVVRASAEDLARVLGVMAGREWPVGPEPAGGVTARGIFVGPTVRASVDGVGNTGGDGQTGSPEPDRLDRSELLIAPGRVVLNGENAGATRLGVYRFLQEELGARWVRPGPNGEILPRRERVALRAGWRVYQPAFYDRVFYTARDLNPDTETGRWFLLNGASRHFEFNHNLHRLFSPEVLAEHPDWAGEHSGEAGKLKGRGPQPDLLRPEVAAYAASVARAAFVGDSGRITFSVSTNDSTDFDESADTRALLTPWRYYRGKPDYSDLVFGFTDAVARRLWPEAEPEQAVDFAGPFVTQLAYMWAEQPPSFPVSPHVMPYLCSDRSQWYDPAFREEDRALAARWAEAGPAILGSWEYYQGIPYLIPRYFPSIQAASMAWLYDHRVRGVFISGKPVWGFDAPKFWLAAQLAWDPSRDADALMDDYFSATYGPAGPAMAAFFDECEVAWMTQSGEARWLKFWNDPGQFMLFPRERCDQMDGHLETARQAAASVENVRERERISVLVEETAAAWAVTRAGAEAYAAWQALGYPVVDGDGASSPEPSAEDWAAFEDACEAWRAVDKEPFRRSGRVIEAVALAEPRARWRVDPASEGWSPSPLPPVTQKMREDGVRELGPETLSPDEARPGWQMDSPHRQGMSVRMRAGENPSGRDVLRIESVGYYSLFSWYSLPEGSVGTLRWEALLRGRVSPGNVVMLRLYFADALGRQIWPYYRDYLFSGDYEQWQRLAVEASIPPGATRFNLGLQVVEQGTGDWLELTGEGLWFRFTEPNPDAS